MIGVRAYARRRGCGPSAVTGRFRRAGCRTRGGAQRRVGLRWRRAGAGVGCVRPWRKRGDPGKRPGSAAASCLLRGGRCCECRMVFLEAAEARAGMAWPLCGLIVVISAA
jgi:hypothetical protein